MQFGREPVAIAHELYGGTPGQQVSVVFELARTLNGPPLVSMPGTLAVAGDHYSATAPIPIGTLSRLATTLCGRWWVRRRAFDAESRGRYGKVVE